MSPSSRDDAERQPDAAESGESRADTDGEAQAPPADFLADDGRPLGDTDEAHDELSPHDLPIGHPGRQAAEVQAGGKAGTTGGDKDPTDRHSEREDDSRAEG